MSTLRTNKASDIFRVGNTVSMITEAGFIGFVPLMLLCFNVLSCFQEASLVSQVIPNIQGSYWKALLYTGIALGAGIMFAPNFVWWRQIAKEIKRVNAKGDLVGKYKDDYESNLNAAWWKYLLIWVVCIITSIITHSLTLAFTTTAFNNQEVLKMLSMKGMEDVSVTFCQVVTFSCFFLDILLGMFTNAQISLDQFKPDNSRDQGFLKEIEKYNEIEKDQAEMEVKLLNEQLEIQKIKNEARDKMKAIRDAQKNPAKSGSTTTSTNTTASNTSTGNNTHSPPGKDVPKSSSGTLIYDVKDLDEFYSILFASRGLTKEKIHNAFKSANQQKFTKTISPALASCTKELRKLYKDKSKENDLNKRLNVERDIEAELKKVEEIFKQLGINPRKTKQT